jgi:hypothetical protein
LTSWGEENGVAQVRTGQLVRVDFEEERMDQDFGEAAAVAFEHFDDFGLEGERLRVGGRGHDVKSYGRLYGHVEFHNIKTPNY